jgi:WD40 repeat protein
VWDAITGRPVTPRLPFEGRLIAASFSPDGRRILVAGADGKPRLWDLATPASAGPSPGLKMAARPPALSPDGRHAVNENTREFPPWVHGMRVWDTTTGRAVTPVFPIKLDGVSWLALQNVSFSPDGRLVLAVICSSDMKSAAQVFDAVTGLPCTSPIQPGPLILKGTFDPAGRRVLLVVSPRPGETESEIQLWDVKSGRPADPPLKTGLKTGNPIIQVVVVAFSPDGRRLAATSRSDQRNPVGRVQVWDVATGKALTPPLAENFPAPWLLAWSPDGRCLAAVGSLSESNPTAVRVWDVITGRPLTPRVVYRDTITRVALSPGGGRLATVGADGTARVWDATTGRPLTAPLPHDGGVSHVEFSPDGRRLLTAYGEGPVGSLTARAVRVWDVATGEPLTPPLRPGADVSPAALYFDPYFGHDRKSPLWWPRGSEVDAAAFTADGRRVVVLNDAHQAQVWDVSPDGRPLGDLELLVRLLSGRRIDPTGAAAPSSVRKADWQKLVRAYPEVFTVPARQADAWRRAKAGQREWARTAWSGLYWIRGNQLVSYGSYAEAADDFATAFELWPAVPPGLRLISQMLHLEAWALIDARAAASGGG